MANLKELMAQQEALAKQIDELRQKEHADAIAQVKTLIAEHMLTQQDVFGVTRGRKAGDIAKAKTKVAAKYRDPLTGIGWSGRGLAPKWFDPTNKSKFLIG
ncbi:H-NS histone family protein [mine drainage metagenome]|uniref:H-NS histone family protein n=1 Tax=mine drainage metagenome TaxID=410659 RepID=A0A1J5PUV5_9ZZZZ